MTSSPPPEEAAPASPPCFPVSKNVDQGNGRTVATPVRHMHRDVAELLQGAGTTPLRRRRKKPAASSEARGRVRYDCAFEEEPPAEEDGDGFAPPRLVWAKVRSHPWWPGQVFDPSDASALALRERRNSRRDAVLVACFGDRTFVWADAEDLLPLRDGFPRLADRSTSMSVLASAVEDALAEVSRRVDAGLSCRCSSASIKRQVFPNSGVRRGARGAEVDAAFARDAFRGEAFVRYVRALAVAPGAGADMLDLAVASAQLKAFTQWRSPDPRGATAAGARASRLRAATPRREERARRGDRGDAPAAGDMTMSMSARAAAAADAAFMRDVFRRGEALEEYASAMTMSPPTAGAERRDLAVATTPQPDAFNQWRGARRSIITECTATMDVAATPPPPPVRRDAATSCISSREDSACENDGDDASETESEDFEDGSEWGVEWKDYVILIQFVAIVLLVCQLMQ